MREHMQDIGRGLGREKERKQCWVTQLLYPSRQLGGMETICELLANKIKMPKCGG